MLEILGKTTKPLYVFLPNFKYGGAEKTMILLAKKSALSGRKTYLIAGSSNGELCAQVDQNVRLIILHRKRALTCFFDLLMLLRKSEQPAEIVTTMYHCNLILCLLRLFIPYIKVTIRESTSIDYYKAHFSEYRFFTFRYLASVFYPCADQIVFPSWQMKTRFLQVIHLPEEKIFVIENPIDCSSIDKLKTEPIEIQEWQRTRRNVIINVGRVDKNKNQLMILQALSKLDHRDDWEFILVGDGPELENLKTAANDLGITERVKFLGFQENPFKFLSRSDIFVLSSEFEGYPNVLVQAKYLKLKIISTDCPTGPREILENYSDGVLIQQNPTELTKELDRILSSKKNRHEREILS